MFFIGMSETSYPGYRLWLKRTCRRANFSPKVLQDADVEFDPHSSSRRRTWRRVIARAGKENSPRWRGLSRIASTDSDRIVYRLEGDNPSTALKAYINIVTDRGTRMR